MDELNFQESILKLQYGAILSSVLSFSIPLNELMLQANCYSHCLQNILAWWYNSSEQLKDLGQEFVSKAGVP
jgi:uncharacterized membrane protein YfbV (UPF0208 family)